MLLRATVTTTIRVAASSSSIEQEFSAKNGFEEEDKEKGGEEKMKGFVHRSKGFLPINLPNPKGESFDVTSSPVRSRNKEVVLLSSTTLIPLAISSVVSSQTK